jgi:hypothetical protein
MMKQYQLVLPSHRVGLALAIVSLSASAGSVVAQQGQAVLLRIAPPVGQASHYSMVQQVRSQSPLADTLLVTMTQTVHMTQTVIGASGETRESKVVIDSLSMEVPGMPGMGNMLAELEGLTQRVTTTTRGEVVEIAVDESTVSGMFQQLAEGIGEGLTGLSMELPEQPVRPGETWDTDQQSSLTMMNVPMTTRTTVTYTLEAVRRRGDAMVATVSFSGTIDQTVGDAGAPEGGPSGGIAGTVSGRSELDLTAGRMLRSSTTSAFEGSMENPMGGAPVPISMTMTNEMTLVGGR